MTGASPAFSPRLRRAACAERERLSSRLDSARANARARKGELAAAEAEVGELEACLAALGPLLEEEPGPAPAGPRGALRGRSIREVAVAVLVRRLPDAAPIHYRTWLAVVEAEVGPVAGKRPEAVFLGQVTRHPLVRTTTKRGFYVLDPGAAERLEARVAGLRSSLAAATAAEADGSPPGRRSRKAWLELGRAERALAEARAALSPGVVGAHAPDHHRSRPPAEVGTQDLHPPPGDPPVGT